MWSVSIMQRGEFSQRFMSDATYKRYRHEEDLKHAEQSVSYIQDRIERWELKKSLASTPAGVKQAENRIKQLSLELTQAIKEWDRLKTIKIEQTTLGD